MKGDGTWATPTDTNNRRVFYGTCSTAAGTAKKVVSLSDTSGWELKAGTIVAVKFTNSNTANSCTLNVNDSGDKSIFYDTAVYTSNSNVITGVANRTILYMYDGTNWVWLCIAYWIDSNNRRCFYGTCATAAGTQVKAVTISDTSGWELKAGTMIGVLFSNTNTYNSTTSAPVKLNVNGTGNKNIKYNGTLGTAGNTGAYTSIYGIANHVHYYMYDGTNWVWAGVDYLDGNNYHASCWTAAGTAAKSANASWYVLRSGNIFTLYLSNSNSSASALTLNVNGTGAKPIYINGSASSSSNYSLPAGTYNVFYDGTNYYIRTDGGITTKGVTNINPSYGSYNINSQMPTTRRLVNYIEAGHNTIGTWSDAASPTETDWWSSDYFKFPASANSRNIDISFKFDPENGNGPIVLTGYILDTSNGKLCLRTANAVTNRQYVAVDITYTPTTV